MVLQSSSRRQFLSQSAAVGWLLRGSANANDSVAASELSIATFQFDVTPPIGHSCCGGWITPVQAIDQPLECRGLILWGGDKPVVLAAVDWTGLLNSSHRQWCEALADAAGTTADRVAVQCVHQHNAPMACLDTQAIVEAAGGLPSVIDRTFFQQCLDRGRQSVRHALERRRRLTHVAAGQAPVMKVASNRRVWRDTTGKVLAMRGSACRDPKLRDMPEGLIDPHLRSVTFYDGPAAVATCHYYAVHPMSYYGDGRVTSDFVGLARAKRQAETGDCLQIYFTGCAGNVAAGKYNDGSPSVRAILADRVYHAMVAAAEEQRNAPATALHWRSLELLPTPRPSFDPDLLASQINTREAKVVERTRPAYTLAWLRRLARREPLRISAFQVGPATLLHLPAEAFVEYQLFAQSLQPDGFVATAAYGDGGTWYIPTADEYPAGGYEVSVAFSDATIDGVLRDGIKQLVAG